MKTMQQAVSMFLLDDEIASLAASSRKRIKIVLNVLVREVGAATPTAQIDRHHIDATMAHWRGAVVDNSLNAYRYVLRRFGRWLADTRLVKLNPAEHLKNVRTSVDASKRKPLSRSQAVALVEIARLRHPRDGMTALILMSTGLRESEALGLRWRDCDFEAGRFTAYRPKRRDWHNAPWSVAMAEAMAEWREAVIGAHGPLQPDWYVVPALSYRSVGSGLWRMHPEWPLAPERRQTDLRSRLKVWLREVGETDLRGRASHTLRRTVANVIADEGGIRRAQVTLGHKSVAMTELYLDRNAAEADLAEWMRGFRL